VRAFEPNASSSRLARALHIGRKRLPILLRSILLWFPTHPAVLPGGRIFFELARPPVLVAAGRSSPAKRTKGNFYCALPHLACRSKRKYLHSSLNSKRLLIFAVAAFGFGAAGKWSNPFRCVATKEARTICHCSVSCGMRVFSAPSQSNHGKLEVTHIEGDADNLVNPGTLCPKGAAAIDCIRSKTRVQYPMYRKPGTKSFERASWDFALERIAKLMEDDRDANLHRKEQGWCGGPSLGDDGFLAGSSLTNEGSWLTYKVARGLGLLQIENQARIDTGRRCPVWAQHWVAVQ
jgi:formate dehydrogenase major subunit